MLAALFAFLTGCSSTPGGQEGEGKPYLLPDFIAETSPQDWGEAAEPVVMVEKGQFHPEFLTLSAPYGESVLVWHFSRLRRNKGYTVSIPLIVDCRDNDSWVEVAVVPGTVIPEECVWPRERIRENIRAKWDPHGGGEHYGHGNSTDGVFELVLEDQFTDPKGELSIVIVVGHWTGIPENVTHHLGAISVY